MKILLHSDEKRGEELPRLGLGYLMSYVNKHRQDVIFDLLFLKEDSIQKVKEFKPDIIGFTSATFTNNKIVHIAIGVKENFPSIPLILGGIHITLFPGSLPECFDVGVIGEGEETFLELIKKYAENRTLMDTSIKGIVFRDKGNLIDTGHREAISPIDLIPPPDLKAMYVGKKGPKHIMTSRGCPYRCRFCCSANIWGRPRFHSAQYVVNEFERLLRVYKRDWIMVYDDLFTMDKGRIEKIADLMVARNLANKATIEIITHADYLNDDVIKNLKRIGIKRISIGMESGSQKVLDYLKNGVLSLDKIRKAVALCKKYDIDAMGSFMVGSPYETEEDIRMTINFIKELKLDQFGLCVTTPFPMTELWEYAKSKRIIQNDEWDDRLWGFHDVNEENINDKIILADMDKNQFYKLYMELKSLELVTVWRWELKNWMKMPWRIDLLFRHIKGRIKPYKKRLKRKVRSIFKLLRSIEGPSQK